MTRLSAMVALVIGLVLVGPQNARAQEPAQSGNKLDRSVLPILPAPFNGKIGRTV